MRKLIFILLLTPCLASAKNITLSIPDDQIKVMENDLIDVEQWIKDMVAGKYSKCLSRAAEQERQLLIKEKAATMPTDEKTLADNLFKRPGYKNRGEIEANSIKP